MLVVAALGMMLASVVLLLSPVRDLQGQLQERFMPH